MLLRDFIRKLQAGSLAGDYSFARAINDSGTAAGYSALANGTEHACVFSAGAVLDLGALGGVYTYSYWSCQRSLG